jgi:hypothetical protein
MPIKVPVFGGNLGDFLWVTPLSKHFPDMVVQVLANDKKSQLTAPIFDGICKVEFVQTTTPTPRDNSVSIHITQRILSAYDKKGKSIPYVKITEEEKEWAKNFLISKNININRCMAFINHNSGSGDETNTRGKYVRPDPKIIKDLAAFWAEKNNVSIVQFGPDPKFYEKDPFDPIPNAVHIRGLNIRQLAACYSLIGRMVSGDTGDYHLMLAVGGKVFCLVPPHSDEYGYKHWDLLYNDNCWDGEDPRVLYCLHENWEFLKVNINENSTVP